MVQHGTCFARPLAIMRFWKLCHPHEDRPGCCEGSTCSLFHLACLLFLVCLVFFWILKNTTIFYWYTEKSLTVFLHRTVPEVGSCLHASSSRCPFYRPLFQNIAALSQHYVKWLVTLASKTKLMTQTQARNVGCQSSTNMTKWIAGRLGVLVTLGANPLTHVLKAFCYYYQC